MKKIIIVCLMSLMFLTGCQVEKQQIAYTVYPIGYLLNRIGGDIIDAVSIQEDEIIQRAQLKEDAYEILEASSMLMHIGDLEPYLDVNLSAISQIEGLELFDLSVLNAIYPFKRYTRIIIDGKETFIEGSYYSSDLFDDVDITDRDLYLWTDPIGMISMAKDIESALSSDYIEMSSVFSANLKSLETDLINLDAQYQALSNYCLKNNQTIKFVSMSASFGNWQKAYGFQVYPVVLSKYGALPTLDQLEVIMKKIVDDGVQYIAYEPNMTDDMITLFNYLETTLNLTRVNLSNLSSLTETQMSENKDYLSIMYENLAVLENMAQDNIVVEPTEEITE